MSESYKVSETSLWDCDFENVSAEELDKMITDFVLGEASKVYKGKVIVTERKYATEKSGPELWVSNFINGSFPSGQTWCELKVKRFYEGPLPSSLWRGAIDEIDLEFTMENPDTGQFAYAAYTVPFKDEVKEKMQDGHSFPFEELRDMIDKYTIEGAVGAHDGTTWLVGQSKGREVGSSRYA